MLNGISHPRVLDWWVSFKTLPPKEAIVALVVTDILMIVTVIKVL